MDKRDDVPLLGMDTKGNDHPTVTDAVLEVAQARAEVAQEIDHLRERVTQEIDGIRERVRVALDWKGWVRRHATLCLASAFAVGFFLGRRR